jgi:hypothetical protein
MKQIDINVPSGDTFSIREQNGNDDDLLSRPDVDEATTINRYIAAIVQAGPEGKRLTLADVEKLLLRDKYTILFKSRIFSLSENLIFGYKWDPEAESIEYMVDLKEYVWDYKTPLPGLLDEKYSIRRIVPYPVDGREVKFSLTSGQEVSFEFLDGVGEKYLLGIKQTDRSINKQLVARAFKVNDGTKMVTVKNFQTFSSKDMMEIRNKMEEVDPPMEGTTSITNPDTQESIELPIIAIKDFYYPVKI